MCMTRKHLVTSTSFQNPPFCPQASPISPLHFKTQLLRKADSTSCLYFLMSHFLLTLTPKTRTVCITPKQLLSRQPKASAAKSTGKFWGLILLHPLSTVTWFLPLQAALSFITRQDTILTCFCLSHLTGHSSPHVFACSSLHPRPPGVKRPRAHSWDLLCILLQSSGDSILLACLLNPPSTVAQSPPVNSRLVCPLPGWHLHLGIQWILKLLTSETKLLISPLKCGPSSAFPLQSVQFHPFSFWGQRFGIIFDTFLFLFWNVIKSCSLVPVNCQCISESNQFSPTHYYCPGPSHHYFLEYYKNLLWGSLWVPLWLPHLASPHSSQCDPYKQWVRS